MKKEDIEDYEEERKLKIFLKKTYLIIISVIIIVLLVINSAPGYHVISVLSGKIVSTTLNEDYTFDIYTGQVVFEKEVFEKLQEIYFSNQKHEFKVCLIGEKQGSNYLVNDIYVPYIYRQDVFSVTSHPCNQSTIISLHSHPPLRCIFSEQDIISFNNFRKINPDGIIGLMCDEDRLSFFGYKQ
jgi:proteasome lid subunit RPN8/RPN11